MYREHYFPIYFIVGMEVYVQLTVQILILLLERTESAMTGGLETIFDQELFGLDPFTLLVLSISWSLLSCVRTHTNLIAMEKGFINNNMKSLDICLGNFCNSEEDSLHHCAVYPHYGSVQHPPSLEMGTDTI